MTALTNYQVVRPVSATSGLYDFEIIKSEFQSIEQAVRWGQRHMHNMPFAIKRNSEPLTLVERELLADLM